MHIFEIMDVFPGDEYSHLTFPRSTPRMALGFSRKTRNVGSFSIHRPGRKREYYVCLPLQCTNSVSRVFWPLGHALLRHNWMLVHKRRTKKTPTPETNENEKRGCDPGARICLQKVLRGQVADTIGTINPHGYVRALIISILPSLSVPLFLSLHICPPFSCLCLLSPMLYSQCSSLVSHIL
ncbi:unnamed protein product, partial [Pylaiella littoralis]